MENYDTLQWKIISTSYQHLPVNSFTSKRIIWQKDRQKCAQKNAKKKMPTILFA